MQPKLRRRCLREPRRMNPNTRDPSDDELVALARDGDMFAFERLVRRHQSRVLRIAIRYLGDVSQAADVTQNTFLQLYRSLPRYVGRGRFTAYLGAIAINQCRLLSRSMPKHTYSLDTAIAPDALTVRPATDCSELGQLLQQAMGSLSDKLRAVVVLRCVEGLELAEIAEALDVPLGTVKSRLFAGMAQLRSSLAEHL